MPSKKSKISAQRQVTPSSASGTAAAAPLAVATDIVEAPRKSSATPFPSMQLCPLSPAQNQRYRAFMNGPVRLAPRVAINGFSEQEMTALFQASLTRREFAAIFEGKGRVSLHGSALYKQVLPASGKFIPDIDFCLHTSESYGQAAPELRRAFADKMLSKVGIDARGRFDGDLGQTLVDQFFAAFVFEERDLGSGLVKIRFNNAPRRASSPTTVPVEVTVRPPDFQLSEIDEIHRAFALTDLSAETPHLSGPSDALITWLDQHRLVWFATDLQGGLLRLVKQLNDGPFQLLQPNLEENFWDTADAAERQRAVALLLQNDMYWLLESLRVYCLHDASILDHFAEDVVYRICGVYSVDVMQAQFLFHQLLTPGVAHDNRLVFALHSVVSEYPRTQGVSWLSDCLSAFVCDDAQLALRNAIMRHKFPHIEFALLAKIWDDVLRVCANDPNNVLATHQRSMLAHAFSPYNTTRDNLYGAIVLAEIKKQPAQAVDRLLALVRAGTCDEAETQRINVYLPHLLARCDQNNRRRLAQSWFAASPHSPAAIEALLALPNNADILAAALKNLLKAAQTQPSTALHLAIARVYLANSSAKKSEDAIMQAANAARSDDERHGVVQACKEWGNDERALALLIKLQSRFSRVSFWQLHLSLHQQRLAELAKDHETALLHANAVLALDADNKDALTFRGAYYLERQDYALAANDFERVKLAYPATMALLSQCYTNLGDIDKGFECLKEYNALEPNSPAVLSTLAKFYSKRGEDTAAVECLQRAQQLEPQDITIALELAQLLTKTSVQQSDDQSQAIDAWLRVCELQPSAITNPDLRRFLYSCSYELSQRVVDHYITNVARSGHLYYFSGALELIKKIIDESPSEAETSDENTWAHDALLRLFQATPEAFEWSEADAAGLEFALCHLIDAIKLSTVGRVAAYRDAAVPTLIQCVDFWHRCPNAVQRDDYELMSNIVVALLAVGTQETFGRAVKTIELIQSRVGEYPFAWIRMLGDFHKFSFTALAVHLKKIDLMLAASADLDQVQEIGPQEFGRFRLLLETCHLLWNICNQRLVAQKALSAFATVLNEEDLNRDVVGAGKILLSLIDHRYGENGAQIAALMGVPENHYWKFQILALATLCHAEYSSPQLVIQLLEFERTMLARYGDPEKHVDPVLATVATVFMPRNYEWQKVHQLIAKEFTVTDKEEQLIHFDMTARAIINSPELLARLLKIAVNDNIFDQLVASTNVTWQLAQLQAMLNALLAYPIGNKITQHKTIELLRVVIESAREA